MLAKLYKVLALIVTVNKDEIQFNSPKFNPRKFLTLVVMISLTIMLVSTAKRLVKTNKLLMEERILHSKTIQEFESKNKLSKSSDSGNGIRAKSDWIYSPASVNLTGCRGEECSFIGQSSYYGEQRDRH